MATASGPRISPCLANLRPGTNQELAPKPTHHRSLRSLGFSGGAARERHRECSPDEPLAVVASGGRDDAASGSEALLGVRPPAQDHLGQSRGIGANCVCLLLDALECPVAIAPVARRHMLWQRRGCTLHIRADMHGDAFVAMEDLDRLRGLARPHLLTDERERHRVVVLVDLHVIVETGATLLPFGELIRLGRKRLTVSAG
jgi:hypothetical protein